MSEQRWSRVRAMGAGSPEDPAASSSEPLSVSEEELRAELSLLGFPAVPRPRLLQFKEELEHLMRSRATSDVSTGSDPDKENIPSIPDVSSDCGRSSAWPRLSDLEAQHCGRDSVSESSFGSASGGRKPMTRKVLRRRSDGRAEVCDESTLSCEGAESEESRLPSRASFIRPPPYSLLDQYRQRSDPVGRYLDYKQSWDAVQGALERGRREARWRVGGQMRVAPPPAPHPRPLPVPNSYIVPTEKKRYGLRWAIRQDLVNGNVPRGPS
ncbi:centriolar and ciliogenesis-associated protein HYLS1 [Gastrophryne carolinensis]